MSTRQHIDPAFAEAVEEALFRLPATGRVRHTGRPPGPERRRAVLATAIVGALIVAGSAYLLRPMSTAAPIGGASECIAFPSDRLCTDYVAVQATGDGASWVAPSRLRLRLTSSGVEGESIASFGSSERLQQVRLDLEGDVFSTGDLVDPRVSCLSASPVCAEPYWLGRFVSSQLTFSVGADERLTLTSPSATIVFRPASADPGPVATGTPTPTPSPDPTVSRTPEPEVSPSPVESTPPPTPAPTAIATDTPLIAPNGYRDVTDQEIEDWADARGTGEPIWIEQQQLDKACMAEHGFLWDPTYAGVGETWLHDGLTTAQEQAFTVAMYGPETDQPYDWRTAGCHGRSVHLTGQDDNH